MAWTSTEQLNHGLSMHGGELDDDELEKIRYVYH